ncbi:B12-binding domain-containing radical SAM protein [Geoalkalibacter sp.]|uniref:B12-binding domain-containing radical SAM protein n=1 Tax=Geoalkalibacter sp. TaxID=3041440 RepID=UPI00272EBEE0|nr:B12-binding domain-containing radical SAM protein [Geoalkalibacter sp.]
MRTLLVTLHSKFIHASLALPYLAAYCGTTRGEPRIREHTVHEPREQVLAALLAEEPEVIAFSVYLWNRRETLDLIDALHAARPEVRCVVGGPEISFDGPELFAAHPGLAALVRGEGEIPLRGLLAAWQQKVRPLGVPRLAWRDGESVVEGPDGPPLADLDAIPSPFAAGLVDLSRGLVYYETSRGCPYTCAFCMSALDASVRSFSRERIAADLGLLMAREVATIKLVDRTFNYDAARAREIFRFILRHNRASRFHFEIGAHLLDEDTLRLLEQVPPGLFQFEIGVQSTLPATLAAVNRRADLRRLAANVARLRRAGNIHLHLDLIAGLPGESYHEFLASLDQVAALRPHHLQVEAVKLLPGSPLRAQARDLGLRHDPNPPYRVLETPHLSFAELEKLRGLGRLLDLTWNSGRMPGFLEGLAQAHGTLGAALDHLDSYWRQQGLHGQPLSLRGLFEALDAYLQNTCAPPLGLQLRDLLARDYARRERVVATSAPPFFDLSLDAAELAEISRRVRDAGAALRGQGVKLQYFAAVFHHLPDSPGRTPLLFLYETRTGAGLSVKEQPLYRPA